MARILVIDNYDSFTHNLVQMFMQYDLEINVYRSDKISIEQIESLDPDYILISPGPRGPANAGISISVVKTFAGKIPIMGVCLGMQCINEAMGGKTVKAPVPVHGKTSRVYHSGQSVFKGVPSPFTAARYHSLMVKISSPDLVVTAKTDDGVVMGIEHKIMPISGVQFHPESFMTDSGFLFIENFLKQGPLKIIRDRAAA
ncbi:MAG: aminodeoxychorismate/anthranilate synthase component II [Desulfobacteraceae bacterium]|nr:aminodeoxychorismate/anthranilate synthase component II [Desulfobacteraceae bacterium]MBC2757731.1 aminodeoxychorismate/anthranilate synthase component II [Desulfobacteraceae bacterium]